MFKKDNSRFLFFKILIISILTSCNGCDADDNKNENKILFDENDRNILNYEIPEQKENSIKNKIMNQKGIFILLLYRNGCPFCKSYVPIFEQLSSFYEEDDNVMFGRVQFSDFQTTKHYQKKLFKELYGQEISTFPCIIIIKDGEIIRAFQGDKNERSISNLQNVIESIR
ncbi:MAG: hypothetical protein GY830_03170 [Bacteroidetes bacterium]|nr:hypothetical protein [Bacteroidota bacterium]